MNTLGGIPPNHVLRFQLRMKIRSLEADDKLIIQEGVNTLDINELQQACRERGMRAGMRILHVACAGVSEQRLRSQLDQWLDLHINRKIPLTLLIMSRALYLPENIPTEDVIKTALSQLPTSIENATLAKLANAIRQGEKSRKPNLILLKEKLYPPRSTSPRWREAN